MRSRGRNDACPLPPLHRHLGTWFPRRQGQMEPHGGAGPASLIPGRSGGLRGFLRRQTPRFAAGSRSCSGRFFSCCTGVHIAVQMPFQEPEAEFLLSDCAFLLPTRFLHRPCTPGRLAGEPAHPCARQASAGSAQLVCPGVRGSSGRVAGGSQWEASASGTLPVGV